MVLSRSLGYSRWHHRRAISESKENWLLKQRHKITCLDRLIAGENSDVELLPSFVRAREGIVSRSTL